MMADYFHSQTLGEWLGDVLPIECMNSYFVSRSRKPISRAFNPWVRVAGIGYHHCDLRHIHYGALLGDEDWDD